MKIKVVLYEDNADFSDSLSLLLKRSTDIDFMGAFENTKNVLNEMRTLQPDIVLMDIDMPESNGLEGLKKIKSNYQNIEVLMLTVFDENKYIFEAICGGASGYILKTSITSKIIDNIIELKNGGAPMSPAIARKVLQLFPRKNLLPQQYELSPREIETLNYLVKGFSYKMIAEKMNVTVFTINAHCKKVYEKLHVHSNAEAIAKALKENIIS